MEVKEFFENFENEMEYFFNTYIIEEEIDIYNEFNLQHELGIYLRKKLKKHLKNYKIEFERNKGYFGVKYNEADVNYKELKDEFELNDLLKGLKDEIDICVYKKDMSVKYAIELKYPSIKQFGDMNEKVERGNRGFPRAMYQFVQDIKFMETLCRHGFDKTFSIVLVNSREASEYKKYYEVCDNLKCEEGIYPYFRAKNGKTKTLKKLVRHPIRTHSNEAVYLFGKYNVRWKSWLDKKEQENGKYYIISIDKK